MHRFFGYGSLVNRATHAYDPVRPARLAGWRRVWVHTRLRPVAYLSVEPDPDAAIDGLVAEVPGGDWSALDARESAYDKHPVSARLAGCGSVAAAQVYAVPARHAAAPEVAHPVLLSYVDTVVQGFHDVFGAAGARRFFATTAGWGGPVLDDRAAPRYPRAGPVAPAARALVDAELAARAVPVLPAPATSA